jgi:hypothetical protein
MMTDQQWFDIVAALGHPHVHTPNRDRLAAQAPRAPTPTSRAHFVCLRAIPS